MDDVARHLIYLYLLCSILRERTRNPFYECACREVAPFSDRCPHDIYVPLLYESDYRDIEARWLYTDAEIRYQHLFRSNPQSVTGLFWHFAAIEMSKIFTLDRAPGFFYWKGRWRINMPSETRILRPYRGETGLILGIELYTHPEAAPQALTSAGLPYGAKAINP